MLSRAQVGRLRIMSATFEVGTWWIHEGKASEYARRAVQYSLYPARINLADQSGK